MPARTGEIGTFERILHLRRLRILERLPPSSLGVVADAARERFFPKGSVLSQEGEPVGAIQVILEGKVHMSRRGRHMGHGRPGAAVGGLGLLARDNSGLEARAEADTIALELDADTVRELLEDHFPIYHHLLREISRILLELLIKDSGGQLIRGPRIEPPALPPRELSLVERILLIRQAPAFSRASINALAELCRALTEVRFPANVTLWREGESARTVVLVVDGVVQVPRAAGGGPGRLGAGDALGIVEAIAEAPRWHDAITETPIVGLHANVESLIDVFEDNFEMAMDYLAAVSQLILEATERVADARAIPSFYGCDEENAAPEALAQEAEGPPLI